MSALALEAGCSFGVRAVSGDLFSYRQSKFHEITSAPDGVQQQQQHRQRPPRPNASEKNVWSETL
jgi:hypothetical protein